MNKPDGTPGGHVIVFRSVEGKLPLGDGWYPKGRDVVETAFLNANREPDIGRPEHMRKYFVRLYGVGALDDCTPNKRTLDARGIESLRRSQCFEKIYRGDNTDRTLGRYRLIDDDTFPVVVGSWKSRTNVVQSLLDELARAPSTRLFRELGRYQLNLRHYEKYSLGKFLSLESANIDVWRGKYDDRVGLVPEMDEFECVV